MLFDSKGSPTQIKGSDLAVAAKAPVAYPSRLVVEPKSVELLPNVALPIRGDRHTIYLGKGKAPERLQVTLEFPADAHLSPLTLSGEGAAQRECGPVLAFLWQRAEASHGVIDPLAGTRLLAGVENAFEDRLSATLDKGEPQRSPDAMRSSARKPDSLSARSIRAMPVRRPFWPQPRICGKNPS